MNEKTVFVDGETLSITDVYMVAHHHVKVEVATNAWPKILEARSVVERIVRGDETVYGVNTGFGSFVNTKISNEDVRTLQINLIRSHATAIGEPMKPEEVRAMMLIRLNSLCKGYSGVHPDVITQIVEFLNLNIVPYVPRIGSLGASGDLAPLSHVALSLIGEGHVLFEGKKCTTQEILREHGLIGVELRAKDGLSLINGTSQMTGYLSLSAHMLKHMLPLADVIYCASLDASEGSSTPLREEVHAVRPHPGQQIVASRMRTILASSEIIDSHKNCDRVQDPYSYRCAPQVHGAVLETFNRLMDTLNIELNSATDNPLIFPDVKNPGSHEIVSQGNFHGEIIGFVSDAMVLGIFELASMSERRMDQMLDVNKRAQKPFLAEHPGLESGLMIVQYVAGSSLSELHGMVHPRTAFSTSTSAGQEDHVSMGATSAYNLYTSIQRLAEILACELMIALDNLDLIDHKSSPIIEEVRKLARLSYSIRTGDCSTSESIQALANQILNGTWLSTVETLHGSLQ